jgi:hypothetical protein
MASWMDQTIRLETEGKLDIDPSGDVNVTWVEAGHSFTVIVPMAEAKRLAAERERQETVKHREAVPS